MRTRLPMVVLYLIALAVTLGISTECKAGPIETLYLESVDQFSLIITSAGFNANDVHMISLSGSQWVVTLTITEQVGAAADTVTITGSARHLVGPHGEGANAVSFPINFTLNAAVDTLPLGAGMDIAHGQHLDVFRSALVFTTAAGANFTDIATYRFVLSGVHTPEPATLILLGTGLAGVAAAARRRRRNQKTKEGYGGT